jgi:hypothetical protein
MDRELLYWRLSAASRCPAARATGSRETAMRVSSTPSFGACLRHGGVGGANRGDCPSGRSLRFSPLPFGTDTASPADRF